MAGLGVGGGAKTPDKTRKRGHPGRRTIQRQHDPMKRTNEKVWITKRGVKLDSPAVGKRTPKERKENGHPKSEPLRLGRNRAEALGITPFKLKSIYG